MFILTIATVNIIGKPLDSSPQTIQHQIIGKPLDSSSQMMEHQTNILSLPFGNKTNNGWIQPKNLTGLFAQIEKYISIYAPINTLQFSATYSTEPCPLTLRQVLNIDGTFEIVLNRHNKSRIDFAREANVVVHKECQKEDSKCKTIRKSRKYVVLKARSDGTFDMVGKPYDEQVAEYCKCI